MFAHFSYLALAGLLAITAFLFTVWFPNLGLIGGVFANPSVSLTEKLSFAISLLGGIGTNFSLLSASYTVAIAALFGTNTSMIVYVLKRKRATRLGQNIAVGSGGIASGALGIGCAACGSLLFSAALPFVGTTGALAMLPLQGEEFGLLGVALLLVSLSLLSRTIRASASCQIPGASRIHVGRLTRRQRWNRG
ncbi:MAG: hypothetical protein GTO41_20810 [Burkholderiales bacterium]|nr:hypothetical protein [Burkholderiales bacterium]